MGREILLDFTTNRVIVTKKSFLTKFANLGMLQA